MIHHIYLIIIGSSIQDWSISADAVVAEPETKRPGRGAVDVGNEDYGYVDPPPDTYRRGGGAPIPHG
ncbi:hypothetical protein E2562_008838 [Oryza meyeriana var. granulata]|uniref:Uncharacterized protein n=1 Tax=Oryza meyeriana var. granulata TaxID=110450 RepID=A0A6G1CYT0_9ORYZ|nr:hypothetical protein E2562_008838 [Oryza meyeriana var. granulata]